MVHVAESLLERRSTVYAACVASFLLGLFFIFVWTPLPWGWNGIDDYGRIAMALAQGEPFPTVHLVWGYAYFLAIFYGLFGDHPAIPLCAQAFLNACIPLMLYYLVRLEASGLEPESDRSQTDRPNERIAVMAAVLVGLFSFNTVYASTQAADSVCTVLVVAMMLCLARGDRQQRLSYFVAAGLLAAAAYQFRPNLLLLPPFIAVLYVLLRSRSTSRFVQAGIFVLMFVLGAAPWVIRNYKWTGLFVPASTHGGVQLWFGTLQTREYRGSWLYNPRAAFEFPPIEYTSIDELPLVVTATVRSCTPEIRQRIDLVYWTNRDRTPRRVSVMPRGGGEILVTLPAQPSPTAVYYYFDTSAGVNNAALHVLTPPQGASDPMTIVVSREHLGDLDVDGHALDVFDIARMLRHVAWRDRLDGEARLDLDRDGRVTEADVRRATALVVDERGEPDRVVDPIASVVDSDAAATLQFRDGSTLTVPREWSGKITDLQLQTPVVTSMASLAVTRSRSFARVQPGEASAPTEATGALACATIDGIAANRVQYRRLPHEMRRFTALALDNIRHDPAGYAEASALRAVRVFIIAGSEDIRTAYQFRGAGWVYALGQIASIAYLVLFAVGVALARGRGVRLFMLLTPIVYVPLTICFMLINARYSMTMQPFVFAFVAVTLVTAFEKWTGAARRPAVHTH
jgi:hypothetical protein